MLCTRLLGRLSTTIRSTNHQTRSISILSLRRPQISSQITPLASPPTLSSNNPSSALSATTLDLAIRPSAHPALASIQLRHGPRDTFNPSHRVRKRRHGFLSRIRTRKGINTLKRRKLKGRKNLSH